MKIRNQVVYVAGIVICVGITAASAYLGSDIGTTTGTAITVIAALANPLQE